MRLRTIAGILSAAASAATFTAYARYRKDIRAIRAAVESGGTIVRTDRGPIEYAEAGEGEPMLVIHGAGGGYDQGLILGEGLQPGFRIIAPSRFGYLKTPLPNDPSPASQADAHAALLDVLGVDRAIVVGASAGGPSAIELALRHPDRVKALILLVPRAYHPTDSARADESIQSQVILRVIERSADFLFWLAIRLSRASVVRYLGVRPELEAEATDDDRAEVDAVIHSIQPLSRRVQGIAADSSIELSPWPLDRISVPTLIVSAEDDLFHTLPGARFTAERIPGAELHVLESGGHLMLGNGQRIRQWVIEFLERKAADRRSPREAEAVPSAG